jgi:ABC transport system ATP-binding/permease protein
LVSHDRAFLNAVVTNTLVIEPDGRVKEYDGGYDDYLRQRPELATVGKAAASKVAASKTAAPKTTVAGSSSAGSAGAARKLSFKERQELASLPERIEALESQRLEFHKSMADPSFYRRAGDEIAAAKARLAALEQELAAAYGRWEDLLDRPE